MKIGIITFHFAYNCGAQLQCLALSKKLEQLGHEVCVINYQPWYHKNRYTPLKNPFYFGKKKAARKAEGDNIAKQAGRFVLGFGAIVYSWRHYFSVKERDDLFKGYAKEFLNETRIYRTLKELKKDAPKCDLYISGSDQLWNAKLTESVIDRAYLLEFGSPDIKRITYAMGASFKDMKEPVEALSESFKKFDAISLRETECYDIINKATDNEVEMHVDVDPTFLLKKEEYDNYMTIGALESEPYILTYTMPDASQKEANKAAIELGKLKNMKVIDVCGNPRMGNKQIEDNRVVGPKEFLWYVKNATYVVTNSFHGTAFSLNFEKDFVTVPHSLTGYRVTEILDKVGLHNRWANNAEDAVKAFDTTPDFETAAAKLEELRNESIDFLVKQTINDQK